MTKPAPYSIKERIIDFILAAGPAGTTVNEIAEAMNTNRDNVAALLRQYQMAKGVRETVRVWSHMSPARQLIWFGRPEWAEQFGNGLADVERMKRESLVAFNMLETAFDKRSEDLFARAKAAEAEVASVNALRSAERKAAAENAAKLTCRIELAEQQLTTAKARHKAEAARLEARAKTAESALASARKMGGRVGTRTIHQQETPAKVFAMSAPIITEKTRVTIAPRHLGRYEVADDFVGEFSREFIAARGEANGN